MRGSGAGIGLVALPIAGVILLILKILRIKHTIDLEEMAAFVIMGMIGLMIVGVFLYCIGISLGICRPLIQQFGCRLP
jgi:hypothetical protein